MKKITAALAFLILGLYSCKKENMPAQQINTNRELTVSGNFMNSLHDFDKNFKGNKTNHPTPTGFFSSLSHALFVGAADLVGAGGGIAAGKEIIGAVGLATGGSGAAVVTMVCAASGAAVASISANEQVKKSSKSEIPWENNPLPGYPGNFESMHDIGILHNDYVSKIAFSGVSQGDWISSTYLSEDDKKVAVMALNHGIYNNVIQNQEQPITAYSNNLDYKALTKSYSDLGYISPNVQTVLNEFLNVYLRINDANDLTEIENFYISKVAEKGNGLTDNERMSLLASISVGHHSLEYWYNKNQ